MTIALAALALAGEAPAAVTIGGDTSTPPDVTTGCGAEPCTIVQSGDPGSLSYAVPTDGVIVRWRIRTDNGIGYWRIRTVAENPIDNFTGTGAWVFEQVLPGAERVFPARLAVTAGTRLALDGPPSATSALGSAPGPGDSTRSFRPPLEDGAAPRTANGFGGGFQLQYNADIEADADRDGYGDETQDECPTNAALQVECVPPETTITKAPKKKIKTRKRRKKVAFFFVANEPATFECRLDSAAPAPCFSPFKAKLKRGKHRFVVQATDAKGTVETVPATARVKIKRRR